MALWEWLFCLKSQWMTHFLRIFANLLLLVCTSSRFDKKSYLEWASRGSVQNTFLKTIYCRGKKSIKSILHEKKLAEKLHRMEFPVFKSILYRRKKQSFGEINSFYWSSAFVSIGSNVLSVYVWPTQNPQAINEQKAKINARTFCTWCSKLHRLIRC